MSTASFLPAAARPRGRSAIPRLSAWFAARVSDPATGTWLVIAFALLHAVIWTAILINLKAAQDIHMDVAEAYAWGQKFLLGYGKHPPLSGWVAGAWFTVFPAADWATYALAMTVVGVGMMICWAIALRVVDRRRAAFVVVMLALYPIFNFKGFKYNPDLLQLVTLPLLVLAYLDAFAKRTLRSGVWLGLAAALALMTKYWVVTMIGAIGVAALLHPARMLFLRSPAPWAAVATLVVAMIPHVLWLREVHFAPFLYAGDTYAISSHMDSLRLVLGYIGHNLALLALPVALAAAALACSPRWWKLLARRPLLFVTRSWSRRPNPGVRTAQAINVWIIQVVVAIGPPLGALAFTIYIKTDWGISLFFLTPLALVAIPALRLRRAALLRIAAIWLVATLAVLALSPQIAIGTMLRDGAGQPAYGSRSQLARELTELWQQRFQARWAVVAAATDVGEPMTFYSPDHPAPLTPNELWSSGLTSLDEAKRLGFIGICEIGDGKLESCEAWMKDNAAGGERMVITTRRFFHGIAAVPTAWNVVVVPPGK
jgi:4-amino-4-deoxy-L-arabinose transferase-like glycosyltransferase